MADLTELQASQTVKISGANPSTGVETFYADIDSAGRFLVLSRRLDGYKETFSAGFTGLVPAASATDVFTIIGSATKTIRILHIQFSMTTTSGSGAGTNISLIKRSTANTGGTSTTATIPPYDSLNAASTSVVRGYTANPSALGTSVGIVRAERYAVPGANNSRMIEWNFGNGSGQALVLRGVAQTLAINFNGTTPAGASVSFDVEWTEE